MIFSFAEEFSRLPLFFAFSPTVFCASFDIFHAAAASFSSAAPEAFQLRRFGASIFFSSLSSLFSLCQLH
jgi:hypothetical protein